MSALIVQNQACNLICTKKKEKKGEKQSLKEFHAHGMAGGVCRFTVPPCVSPTAITAAMKTNIRLIRSLL